MRQQDGCQTWRWFESQKNDVRICLDPKPFNKALQTSHCQIPTLDEVVPQLSNKAKVFTVADVKSGFWHMEVDQAASELTTFGTPFGRYRCRSG